MRHYGNADNYLKLVSSSGSSTPERRVTPTNSSRSLLDSQTDSRESVSSTGEKSAETPSASIPTVVAPLTDSSKSTELPKSPRKPKSNAVVASSPLKTEGLALDKPASPTASPRKFSDTISPSKPVRSVNTEQVPSAIVTPVINEPVANEKPFIPPSISPTSPMSKSLTDLSQYTPEEIARLKKEKKERKEFRKKKRAEMAALSCTFLHYFYLLFVNFYYFIV